MQVHAIVVLLSVCGLSRALRKRQAISFGRKAALPGGAHGVCVWLSDLHGVMRALTRGRSSCRSTLQHDCGLGLYIAFSTQVSNERLDSIEVSTSLCGSDNPGSIPGQDNFPSSLSSLPPLLPFLPSSLSSGTECHLLQCAVHIAFSPFTLKDFPDALMKRTKQKK